MLNTLAVLGLGLLLSGAAFGGVPESSPRALQKEGMGGQEEFWHYGENHAGAMNSLFVELGGNGLVLTVNYERLVLQHLGIRLGWGWAWLGETVPVMINYYIGEKYKLELGVGVVFLPAWDAGAKYGSPGGKLFSFTVGQKYQAREGGVMVRLSLTPFYDPERVKGSIFGGVSVGWAF